MALVTYCTGLPSLKRRTFRSFAGNANVVSVDNDEVVAAFSLDKKHYFIYGSIPYSNMTIEQYIACNRSLITRLPIKRSSVKLMLSKAGLKCSVKTKMKKLSIVEYRIVSMVAKLAPDTNTLYLNFDGLEYSRTSRRQLKKYINILSKTYTVFLSVSDTRFIPTKATIECFTADGIVNKSTKQRVKSVSKYRLLRTLKRCGMDIALPEIKTVTQVRG